MPTRKSTARKAPINKVVKFEHLRPWTYVLSFPCRKITDQLTYEKRYISFFPTVAFPATLQSSWEALAASFQAGLLNGGPTALVWGLLLCLIGSLSLALSLAEMASITPVVGAQYRWSALYAPRGFGSPAFWSLLQGWITVFAWMALCAQVCFLEGTLVCLGPHRVQCERLRFAPKPLAVDIAHD